MRGQLHALAVLLLGKVPPVPTDKEAELTTASLDVTDKIKLSYSHQESTPSMCKSSNTVPENCDFLTAQARCHTSMELHILHVYWLLMIKNIKYVTYIYIFF